MTTDHISPAGSIARNSPAAQYLGSKGLTPREFNSYGSRRGNDDVMGRGTFANIRLVNKFVDKPGPRTKHFPSEEEMSVFDCASRYKAEGRPAIILAGKEYGSGSSRDWAAKGPWMLVCCVCVCCVCVSYIIWMYICICRVSKQCWLKAMNVFIGQTWLEWE